MRKFAVLAALAMTLSGCAPIMSALGGLPPAPAAVADRTALDEQTALSVELAYQAAALAISTAVDAGILKGENAAKVAAMDRKAYRAVLAVRAAYDAGNATSYGAAAVIARNEIAALIALIG